MQSNRHSMKDYEYLLGRAQDIYFTEHIKIQFKAMEINQEHSGRIMISGYGIGGHWLTIPASTINRYPKKNRA